MGGRGRVMAIILIVSLVSLVSLVLEGGDRPARQPPT